MRIEGKEERSCIVEPKDLVETVRIYRDHTGYQFKVLVDVTAVDYYGRLGSEKGERGEERRKSKENKGKERFELVYHRLSVRYGTRMRIKTRVDEVTNVPSRTGRYEVANWIEREVWDRFGIGFEGHPDRRRLLTDYGFEGYPMRKDYPLTGYTEVRYDEEEKRVVSEGLERSQEYRSYEYRTDWKILPNEKVSN